MLQNKSLSKIGFEKAEIEPNKVVIYLKFLIPEMLKYESMTSLHSVLMSRHVKLW